MSKKTRKALDRLETALEALSRRQAEILIRLERQEQGGSGDLARARGSEAPAASPEEVASFLDRFRVGESLGEAVLGAWIEVCSSPTLRGGLRTIQLREAVHAQLLEQRLKELGSAARAELPETILAQTLQLYASPEADDGDKLEAFLAEFPDVEQALAPIHDLADRLDHDPETQALLRTIAQDERATLEFLHASAESF